MSGKQRKLPEWMVKNAKRSKKNQENKGARKTVQRNAINNFFSKQPQKFSLNRSADDDSILSTDKFEPEIKDFVTYSGKIHYITDFYDCAERFDSLIAKIDAQTKDLNDRIGIGFDLEWSFNYTTGPDKTAVMQICFDLDECYVVQVSKMNKIPASLTAFLNHPKTVLHGVNIKNDLRKLERDFPYIKADPLIEKCIDLGTFYNQVFNSSERWSLANLALQTLKQRVDKNRQVRMSNWNMTLSKQQLMYASLDVYISQRIYLYIKEKQAENSENLDGFFSVYSEALGLDKSTNINDEIEKLLNF